MKRCKHENADHLMPGDVLTPMNYAPIEEGVPVLVEQFRCLDCGAWLPLGPSNDEPEQVKIEMRAAEIAAVLRYSNKRLITLTSFAERRGLWLHAQAQRNKFWGLADGLTKYDHAGYLARVISTHESGER